MARKLRVQYPGAIYHVMNRGDRRAAIFVDDIDRQLLMETLQDVCVKRPTGKFTRGVSCATTSIWPWRRLVPTWSLGCNGFWGFTPTALIIDRRNSATSSA